MVQYPPLEVVQVLLILLEVRVDVGGKYVKLEVDVTWVMEGLVVVYLVIQGWYSGIVGE